MCPRPALLHRCPGHFSLFGPFKLLEKIEDSKRTQPVATQEGFSLLIPSTGHTEGSPKQPPVNTSQHKPGSFYENPVSRQTFQPRLLLYRNAGVFTKFPKGEWKQARYRESKLQHPPAFKGLTTQRRNARKAQTPVLGAKCWGGGRGPRSREVRKCEAPLEGQCSGIRSKTWGVP